MKNKIVKSIDFAGSKISYETGELAPRANAAILASSGETVVLATVAISQGDTDRDYFPLTVEYVEKFYAGGIISGSRFVKRERYPSEGAILKARMIDRSLRPLFPENFRKEVQIVVTVLSYDDVNDPGILGINAAAAAVMMSTVPFEGPVAGVRIGRIDGQYVVNPKIDDMKKTEMNFVISGTKDAIVMLDAEGNQVEDSVVSEAFDLAVKEMQVLLDFNRTLHDELKPEKLPVPAVEEDVAELTKLLEEEYMDKINEAIYEKKGNIPGERRGEVIGEIVADIMEKHKDTYSKMSIEQAIEKKTKKTVRKGILEDGKRPSGRGMDEIRELVMRTSVLPRTHGSALFSRGVTQALSVVTLGSTRLEQTLESFEGEETKKYMHHYNGPSYSLGEAGRFDYNPGRREVGHGALAEKALEPVIPSEEDFPYTIRVVSEVLAQQGSSSMASTCGSTLALMDAGVPIKAPVAGIAIGLVTSEDGQKHVLLTDVQDLEDFYGDMDFKVTGTEKGVTAIQMDNKLLGVPAPILKEALVKAQAARMEILKQMKEVIAEPRTKVSQYAPKNARVKVEIDRIAELIGPGGKVIKGIIEQTGVDVDIKDDGNVYITGIDEAAIEHAKKLIDQIIEVAEVGKVYEGVVDKIMPYGAFVDVTPAISGLVHISEVADGFVKDVSEHLKEGQTVKVKAIGIDDQGRVSFSIKQAQTASPTKEDAPKDPEPSEDESGPKQESQN